MTVLFEKDHIPKVIQDKWFASLELQVSEEWSSQNENHREKIRQSICETLKVSQNEKKSIQNLNSFPQIKTHDISISHCPLLGLWAALPKKAKAFLGIDVEETSRLKKRVVRRVCSSQEWALCAGDVGLWLFKEAAFKALSKGGDPIKSFIEVEITAYKSKEGVSYFKSISFGKTISGFVWNQGPIKIAISSFFI